MRRASLMVGCVLLACQASGAAPSDRVVEVAQPIQVETEGESFLGAIEVAGGTIDARRIGALGGGPIVPDRAGRPGTPVIVEFEALGLSGVRGRLGLVAPRGAARQEVAFDMPGQPSDPRSEWIDDIDIAADGALRFELPAPGEDWHAPWAVVVLELRRRWSPLPAYGGPRSEMLSDETRISGGRIVLGIVEVERRPTRVQAVASATPIVLDGVLDELAWQHAGAALVESRTGEPAIEIDARLGGRTMTHFAWDADHLYVAGSLPDRDLYAPHRERDDPLYRDEAFEVFLAGDSSGSRYLEHQVSARGVVFDARFAKYRKGDESWNGEWRSAVALDGDLEQRGYDYGWTVELAFPWTELCEHTKIDCPPRPGQELRVNVFRLDKPDREQQVGLALSPTLEPDFHAWANAAELELLGPDDGGAR